MAFYSIIRIISLTQQYFLPLVKTLTKTNCKIQLTFICGVKLEKKIIVSEVLALFSLIALEFESN